MAQLYEDSIMNSTDFNSTVSADGGFGGARLMRPLWGWWIKQLLTPVIVAIGSGGNIMSFALMKTKNFRQKSYSHYLCALAVFDTLTLVGREVHLANDMLVYRGYPGVFTNFNAGACKLYNFSEHVCYLMSSWLIVAMAFERFVVVYFPFKKALFCRPLGAVIVIITFFVIMSYTQVFRLVMMTHDGGKCVSTDAHLKLYVALHTYLYQITLIFILPLVLVLVANSLVLFKIQTVKKDAVQGHVVSSRTFRFYNRQHKTTYILLAISFTYVLTLLPLLVVSLLAHTAVSREDKMEAYKFMISLMPWADIAEVVSSVNYGINFIIYVLSGQAFRFELRKIFTKERHTSFSSVRTRETVIR